MKNLPAAALSSALNASRGTRARAVHLVIVEQTLEQGIAGGLNAIPVEVLAQAVPQLARLPRLRASLELQILLQCMRGIVEERGHSSKSSAFPSASADHEFIELPDFLVTAREPEARRMCLTPHEDHRLDR